MLLQHVSLLEWWLVSTVKQIVMLLCFIPVESGQNASDHKNQRPGFVAFSVVSLCNLVGHGGKMLAMWNCKEENSLAAARVLGM